MFVFRLTVTTIMSAAPTILLGALKPHLQRCSWEHTFAQWEFLCVCDCSSISDGFVWNWPGVNEPCPLLQTEFECINPKKLNKKNYKNSGVICIKHCEVMFFLSLTCCNLPIFIVSCTVYSSIHMLPWVHVYYIWCTSLYIVNVFVLLGPERVYLSGLYHGGVSDQLHREFGNIDPLLISLHIFLQIFEHNIYLQIFHNFTL